MAMSRGRRFFWIAIGLALTLSFAAAVLGAIALFARRSGISADGRKDASPTARTLAISLGGSLEENPAPGFSFTFAPQDPPSFAAVIRAMDRAARRSDIDSVMVRVGGLGVGWARALELHGALARLREGGKKVVALLEDGGNMEYFVATAASEIRALPESVLLIHGLSAEVTFLKGTFEKIGVEAQFVSVGRYKSAPNQYLEKQMTPADREQMTALIGGLYGDYVKAIARSRKKPEAEVEALLAGGPYDADQALAKGLVDELDYPEEAIRESGEGRRHLGDFRDQGGAFDTRPKVALVFVDGEILPGESQSPGPFSDGFAGSDTVAEALRDAREDDSVKAVILRVNSPGGSGSASDVIAREVELTAESKPVIASMGDYAASGGYYVSAPATAIVASPTTITGSIGVFFGKFVLKGLFDKVGMTSDYADVGQGGSFASASRRWSERDLARVESMATGFYDRFLALVAEHREMEVGEVHEVAQGRVWTGAQAKEAGLVDELGGFARAVSLAKEKAGIDESQDVAVMIIPRRRGPFEELFQEQTGWDGLRVPSVLAWGAGVVAPRPAPTAEQLAFALRARLARQSNTLWARLPFTFVVR